MITKTIMETNDKINSIVKDIGYILTEDEDKLKLAIKKLLDEEIRNEKINSYKRASEVNIEYLTTKNDDDEEKLYTRKQYREHYNEGTDYGASIIYNSLL